MQYQHQSYKSKQKTHRSGFVSQRQSFSGLGSWLRELGTVLSEDWDEWIEVIKTSAIASDIWNLVNPAIANPSTLEEPPAPKPTDVNPRKTTFSALDEDEKEELRELQRERKRNLSQYGRRKQALATLRVRIQETITRANLSYTFNCETVHGKPTLRLRFTGSYIQLHKDNSARQDPAESTEQAGRSVDHHICVSINICSIHIVRRNKFISIDHPARS